MLSVPLFGQQLFYVVTSGYMKLGWSAKSSLWERVAHGALNKFMWQRFLYCSSMYPFSYTIVRPTPFIAFLCERTQPRLVFIWQIIEAESSQVKLLYLFGHVVASSAVYQTIHNTYPSTWRTAYSHKDEGGAQWYRYRRWGPPNRTLQWSPQYSSYKVRVGRDHGSYLGACSFLLSKINYLGCKTNCPHVSVQHFVWPIWFPSGEVILGLSKV